MRTREELWERLHILVATGNGVRPDTEVQRRVAQQRVAFMQSAPSILRFALHALVLEERCAVWEEAASIVDQLRLLAENPLEDRALKHVADTLRARAGEEKA